MKNCQIKADWKNKYARLILFSWSDEIFQTSTYITKYSKFVSFSKHKEIIITFSSNFCSKLMIY